MRSVRMQARTGQSRGDPRTSSNSLPTDADAWFARELIRARRPQDHASSFDMRYVGQNFELAVPLGASAVGGNCPSFRTLKILRARFFARA